MSGSVRLRLPNRPTSRPFSKKRLRLAVLTLALIASVVLFLQLTLLPGLVRRPLERSLGGAVRITRVSFSLSPGLVIHNLRVLAPGAPGEASRVLSVSRVRIELDGGDLARARVTPTRLVLVEPRLRISQDLDTGAVNAASISPSSGGGGGALRLPQMEIRDGAIELGEHSAGGDYEPFLTLPIEGSAAPDPNNGSRCAFTLRSQPSDSNLPPTKLSGFFDLSTLSSELALTDFTFGEFADLWTPSRTTLLRNQLDISGRIPAATLSYSPETGPVATFLLERVGINLPVPEQAGAPTTPTDLVSITADTFNAPSPRLLRMTEVSGRISIASNSLRAELEGSIADVRCRAELSTRGLSLAAPFRLDLSTATPFSLRQRAAILPFAPPIVHERLRTFSGPTALVEAQVRIERKESLPDKPTASPSYAGLLTFREGRAAFEDFPYPFSNLTGVVRFSDSEIRIEKIAGTHPSGAKLLAEGTIVPASDEGEVTIHVTAVDVPLDAEFASCLPTDMQPIVDSMFDGEALDRLLALNALAPESGFRLAGSADIDVHIHRPFGPDQEWSGDVDVRSDAVGLLTRNFPLPAMAKDVTVRIRDRIAEIDIARIEPLSGGLASLRGSVRLSDAYSETAATPSLTIRAQEVPIDGLLLQALEASVRARNAESDTQPDTGLSILRRLGLEGMIDAEATVSASDQPSNELTYDIRARLREASARPPPLAESPDDACMITGISGDLEFTPQTLRIPRLEGRLVTSKGHDAGAFVLALDVTRDPSVSPDPSLSARITTTNVDLGAPMENIIAAVTPGERAEASRLRRERLPRGRVDAAVALETSADRSRVLASATITAARDASFDTPIGRVSLTSSGGLARVDEAGVRFDMLSGTLSLDAEPLGAVTVRGAVALRDDAPSDLHVAFRSDELPPATLHRLLDAASGKPVNLEGLRLAGAFDVDASLIKPANSADTTTEVTVRPRAFIVQSADDTIRFDRVAGTISARQGVVRVENVWAATDDLAVSLDGIIDPATGPDLRFAADAPCLSPSLLTLIPPDPREAILALGLDIRGPVSVRDARLAAAMPNPGAPLQITGTAMFHNASADVGLAISDARGALRINAAPPTADLAVRLDAFKLGGLSVFDADADIEVDAERRTLRATRATAACHQGLISVEAAIAPSDPADPVSSPRFEADVTLYGLAFGPALQEIRRAWTSAAEPVEGVPPDRGLLDAHLTLGGALDDPASRIGRGSFRITQGKIISVPIINRLIELSNLSLPFDSPLDEAFARFFLRGPRISFERLTLASDAITLVGQGDVAMPNMDLNLRFTSRSNFRLPLLTDLFEVIRNEIITTTVVGPITAPQISPSAFSGTRDALDELFGQPAPSEAPTLRPDR